METNYLRTFMVVLESGSMSEAARRLDLTPAAVAQQMRVLERDLGVPLLRRAGRTVSPTEGATAWPSEPGFCSLSSRRCVPWSATARARWS